MLQHTMDLSETEVCSSRHETGYSGWTVCHLLDNELVFDLFVAA